MPKMDVNAQGHLVFSFPEVHPKAILTVVLHRTLRIPDDGQKHNLPPGLGVFPVRKIDNYLDRVPADWVEHGGVMIPMYTAEALYAEFHPTHDHETGVAYPMAIRLAAGMCSAVTGAPFVSDAGPGKAGDDQDYMVVPGQKYLDGFVVEKGVIKQFVAAPLGEGVTAEAQLTGKEEFGGIQIQVFPMKAATYVGRYPKRPPPTYPTDRNRMMRSRAMMPQSASFKGAGGQSAGAQTMSFGASAPAGAASLSHEYSSSSIAVLSDTEARAKRPAMYEDHMSLDMERGIEVGEREELTRGGIDIPKADMGLGVGGQMQQEVYVDAHGIEAWDTASARVYVHLTAPLAWKIITREDPHPSPVTAAQYARFKFAWFDHYRADVEALDGSAANKGLQSVLELGFQKVLQGGKGILPDNGIGEAPGQKPVQIGDARPTPLGQPEGQGGNVRDGKW